MRGFRLFGVVAAFVVAFATNGVCAQTATATAGKPIALLAGLRPPHESKYAKHVAHAKAAHEAAARHSHLAAHARHASATKLAARHHVHHEAAVTASAFAEEPPPQAAAPPPPPAPNWPVVNAPDSGSAPPVAAPASENANAGTGSSFANPDAAKVRTIKITMTKTANPGSAASAPVASVAAPANDSVVVAASVATAAPTAMAASENSEPATKATVGSASWIAQVLAALGGAVAAGVVAWFLIGGSKPVRTYG